MGDPAKDNPVLGTYESSPVFVGKQGFYWIFCCQCRIPHPGEKPTDDSSDKTKSWILDLQFHLRAGYLLVLGTSWSSFYELLCFSGMKKQEPVGYLKNASFSLILRASLDNWFKCQLKFSLEDGSTTLLWKHCLPNLEKLESCNLISCLRLRR